MLRPTARLLGESLDVPIRCSLLPGHGPSPWGLELGSYSEVVDALAQRLFPDGDASGQLLAGYSLGGRLALGVALRVRGLRGVVAFGAHLGLTSESERSERQRWDDQMAAQVRRDGVERFFSQWAELPLFASQRSLPADVLAEQTAIRNGHSAAGISWAFSALGTGRMPNLLPELLASSLNITLVAGSLDAKFCELYQPLVGSSLRVIRLEGAGHNAFLEDPVGSAVAIQAIWSHSTNGA
jgi:2-succinyl-6-hydroxy-2,4-cyclohexadiene-1-carboxylate synthase